MFRTAARAARQSSLTLVVAVLLGPALPAPPAARGAPAERPLILESVTIEGNVRTPQSTVLWYLPLRAGESVDQQTLVDAVEALRRAELFASVEFYTRPGAGRGRFVLVLEVREKRSELRLGSGNSDLDGWYLIPVAFAFDNRLGRGEIARAQVEFGYRHAGVALDLAQPRLGDGRSYFGARAALFGTDRVWFRDGVEYRHPVGRGSFETYLGRRLGSAWAVDFGVRLEHVDADSTATVHTDDDARGVARGDELAWDALPSAIAADAGARDRTLLRAQATLDTRGAARLAGSPVAGWWGRALVEQCLQGDRGFTAASLDVRGYAAAPGGALCARGRAAVVGADAAFYDRLYLGGLYTVRGYPSQSLTRPEGDTWLWSASCEYRAPLVGERARPRLAGLLFIDAGDSGDRRGTGDWRAAASAGWGLRLRVAWAGWLGLDVAAPLSPTPVDEAFRVHGSIGWTF